MSPLAPERYKLQFTIGEKTLEKLELAKDMLRHAVPSGDLAEVFDRALTVLLEDLAKKKFSATEHPHASRGPAPSSRHIPAEVKRAVWLRDLGRCTFVGANSHWVVTSFLDCPSLSRDALMHPEQTAPIARGRSV